MAELVFKTPEEEIEYLRSQFRGKADQVKSFEGRIPVEEVAHKVVQDFAQTPPAVVPQERRMGAGEKQKLLEHLDSRKTDEQVAYLATFMEDKGIKQAIEMAEASASPYLFDDFCRYLVAYVQSGHEVKRNNISKEEWKALHMVLYEIMLPPSESGDQASTMMRLMERFYVSMQAIARDDANKEQNYYSLELAVSTGGTQATFYVAVHVDIKAIFEKMVQGVFPEAQVKECANDYNIFQERGIASTVYAKHKLTPALPVTTYQDIEGDPIALILSTFSKIKKDGEGLAIQVLVKPGSEKFQKKYGELLDSLRKGYSLKRSIEKQESLLEVFRSVGTFFANEEDTKKAEEKEKEKRTRHDDAAQELIQKKLESTLVDTNIRIIASSESLTRSNEIIRDVEASFVQFNKLEGNGFEFEHMEAKKQTRFIHEFVMREWSSDQSAPLNVSELASLYHFPLVTKDMAQLKEGIAAQAKAPSDFKPGVLLGVNDFHGERTQVTFEKEDRVRHMYVIGQTGTGKTTILKNMIIQDIKNGDGCCFIDPHGSDVQDILACVPESRKDDIIYFDPSYIERVMGLNMLEYDQKYPEQKTFVVNELLGIFNKLFDMKTSGGPGFEQYFRNAALLVMEHPASGNTLLEIARVFSDKDFRDYKLSKTKNPLLVQFWQNAEKTTGETGLQNWTQYVTSKFDVFLSNDIMRPIIAQETSAFNFRDIMDNKKIFLINLSKGRMGDMNANLIGLIVVGKFLQAALSRVDSPVRPDFYLYIDEFQNITTPAISAILSEARKYRLSLNIAHQFIAQLPEDIKGAVFGNVGNMAVFRVGPDDAKYLESQFAPTFSSADIMKIENRHAYVKMLIGGNPQKPFDIATLAPEKGNLELLEVYKQLSYNKYGRLRSEVEEEIFAKYNL